MAEGRFLLRTVVVAIAMFALGFCGHQLLLGQDYIAIEPIMRSKAAMRGHMPFALIVCLVFSAPVVWIYSPGRSGNAWFAQGDPFWPGNLCDYFGPAVPYQLRHRTLAGNVRRQDSGVGVRCALMPVVLVAALSKNDAARAIA